MTSSTENNVQEEAEKAKRLGMYRLDMDGRTPILCASTQEWAEWFERQGRSRIVRQHEFTVTARLWGMGPRLPIGKGQVSTVFLGLDHGCPHNLTYPVLWESMVFYTGKWPGPQNPDQLMWRYRSYDDALRGHETLVACVQSGGDPNKLTLPGAE